MTKTQYYTAATLDGFIADENNSLSWLFESDSGPDKFKPFFADVGAFAMGRTTYEWVLEHDQLRENPIKWADYYGDVPAWVFSNHKLSPVPTMVGRITWPVGSLVPNQQIPIAMYPKSVLRKPKTTSIKC